MIVFLQRLRLLSLPLLLSAALAIGGLLFVRMAGEDPGPLPVFTVTAAFLCAIAAAACNGLFVLRIGAALKRPVIGYGAGIAVIAIALLLLGPMASFAVPVLIVGIAVVLALGLLLGGVGFGAAFGLLTLFAPEI